MKLTSRVALAVHAGDGNGGHRKIAAQARPREEHVAPRAVAAMRYDAAQLARLEAAAGGASRYEISCITAEFDAPHWNGTWRRLLAASPSPEKIYQTPEFFRFLADTRSGDSDQFELFAIRDRRQDKFVGMVPVRLSNIVLDTRLGNVTLLCLQRRAVRMLGSVPLMPGDPALLHQLFAYLLAAFPDCAAVSMQAFPSDLRAHLDDPRHHALVVHGWRGCHTVPLPETLAQYMAKLNGKKRYNLARQHRLLEQSTGPLQLVRVDRSADVKELAAGLAALANEGGTDAGISARDYRVLAANRLLLSYVLKSGDDVIAVIAGSRYGDTWHVHQILYAQRYRHLSAGAVAMQSALENVIAEFAFACADFGYGEPRYSFASTHILKQRGHVLVVRKTSAARWLFGAFVLYDDCHAACVRVLRPLALRVMRLLRR